MVSGFGNDDGDDDLQSIKYLLFHTIEKILNV